MSIQYMALDSNPHPLEHESSPITTRQGLPPKSILVFPRFSNPCTISPKSVLLSSSSLASLTFLQQGSSERNCSRSKNFFFLSRSLLFLDQKLKQVLNWKPLLLPFPSHYEDRDFAFKVSYYKFDFRLK